jgi:hypothetical protein
MDTLQEGSAKQNLRLETALEALVARPNDSAARQEAVAAFMAGFCLIPIAAAADADAECVVLIAEGTPGAAQQEVELLTDNGAMLCFSSYEALRIWDTEKRAALPMEGKMLVQLCTEAEGDAIRLNSGLPTETTFSVNDNQLAIV